MILSHDNQVWTLEELTARLNNDCYMVVHQNHGEVICFDHPDSIEAEVDFEGLQEIARAGVSGELTFRMNDYQAPGCVRGQVIWGPLNTRMTDMVDAQRQKLN